MRVDLKRCTGCGACLEVCPVEAISLAAGKAAIDNLICLSCGACAPACPEGAIITSDLPVVQKAPAIQPPRGLPAAPVVLSRSNSQGAWAKPVLAFVGREIVPRLADTLMAALDRRLSTPGETRVIPGQGTTGQINGVRRQMRRRRRGRKF